MHKIIEAADTLDGKLALTIAWPDGTETVEIVSEKAARGLGYHYPDEPAPVDGVGAAIKEIEDYDAACAEAQYTDVGVAWEVFHSVLAKLRGSAPADAPVTVAA